MVPVIKVETDFLAAELAVAAGHVVPVRMQMQHQVALVVWVVPRQSRGLSLFTVSVVVVQVSALRVLVEQHRIQVESVGPLLALSVTQASRHILEVAAEEHIAVRPQRVAVVSSFFVMHRCSHRCGRTVPLHSEQRVPVS